MMPVMQRLPEVAVLENPAARAIDLHSKGILMQI
jgi:hypothetical protein